MGKVHFRREDKGGAAWPTVGAEDVMKEDDESRWSEDRRSARDRFYWRGNP